MYQAKDLIRFVSKQLHVPQKKLLTSSNQILKSNRIIQLYQEDYSDEEISKLLYNKNGKDQNFRKLKSRMLEKAAESILSKMDSVSFRNKYDISIFKVQKLILISNLLLLKDNRKIAIPLLKKAFKVATNIQFTPYIIQLARILTYSSAYNSDKKMLNYYIEVVKKHVPIYEKELQVETDYFRLLPKLTEIAEYTEETKKEIKSMFGKTQSILRKTQSHTLKLLNYRIAIRHYHSIHDFENLKLISYQALQYLNKNPNLFQNARAGEFSLYEMDSCLRLQAYAQGSQCATRCAKYFIPYTSTWSIFYEYYFLLAMRTSNFRKATEICERINESNYKLNKMLSRQKDKWRIYEAFLNFASSENSATKQFNLYKYLNEINLLSKDKKGFNFLVIISKFLLLINIQNHNELIQMEDAFRIYLGRYIKSNEYPRHHIFGKFILHLLKKDFDPYVTDEGQFIKQLQSHKILEETEIIPYEKLITIIIEKCRGFNNYRYSNR